MSALYRSRKIDSDPNLPESKLGTGDVKGTL